MLQDFQIMKKLIKTKCLTADKIKTKEKNYLDWGRVSFSQVNDVDLDSLIVKDFYLVEKKNVHQQVTINWKEVKSQIGNERVHYDS